MLIVSLVVGTPAPLVIAAGLKSFESNYRVIILFIHLEEKRLLSPSGAEEKRTLLSLVGSKFVGNRFK
jgi:hypothetical protein